MVEDEYLTSVDIKNNLNSHGYDVIGVADTGTDAIRMTEELKPDLILMDITLKGKMTGIEAARHIHEHYRIPVVYLTAHSDEATVEQAVISEPFGYLIKPFDDRALNTTIQMALYKHGMEEKLSKSERTNRVLLNTIPDALILIDRNKKIVAINEKMAMNLGINHEDFERTSITELVLRGSISFSLQQIDNFFATLLPVNQLEPFGERWIETVMHPVTDSAGIVDLVAIQSHDITEWKHLEEQLEKDGISQIERNMEQFQILNDQIRNPLQVIAGYVALGDSQFKSNIEEQIRKIDDLVTKLDSGWLESEKVRSFLFRHYKHGSDISLKIEDGGRVN